MVVDVHACALNRLDLWVRGGLPNLHIDYPHILGSDIAGIVRSVGEGVDAGLIGREVILNPGISCGRCEACLSGWDNLCPDYRILGENTTGGYAATGTGLGPRSFDYVLGIVKAYTTRVGGGPFPTELFDEFGEHLSRVGHEFGAVTGRKRRCGWFDAVALRRSIINSSVSGLCLTKLDVLDGLEEIKVCVGYELDGKRIERFPFTMGAQAKLQPIWEIFEGWGQNTRGARSFAELPATCIKYVRRVEELVGCPVALLSTSPEREDTILMTDPFRD